MILKQEVDIDENETTGELWNKLSKIGGELLVKTLEVIENGTAPRIKQGEEFTHAPMLNKEMSKIDWENQDTETIKNLIRGLNPIMGAYSMLDGKKIKFWRAKSLTDNEIFEMCPELNNYKDRYYDLFPGTILFCDDKTGLFIKTIDGAIEVLEIQGENAKKMDIKDFLRGNKLYAASVFE